MWPALKATLQLPYDGFSVIKLTISTTRLETQFEIKVCQRISLPYPLWQLNTSCATFLSGLPWQEKLAVKGLRIARVKATDLVLGEVQIVPSFAEAPLLLAQGTLGGEVSRLSLPFATLEREENWSWNMSPNCFDTGDAPVSYWSFFLSVLSNSPRSLCKS